MEKVYFDYYNNEIIVTSDISIIDIGSSIKFTCLQEMTTYIKDNKKQFKGYTIYKKVNNDNTSYWQEITI